MESVAPIVDVIGLKGATGKSGKYTYLDCILDGGGHDYFVVVRLYMCMQYISFENLG